MKPIAATASGFASGHAGARRAQDTERKSRRPAPNNADIRPWIGAGEAAELVLSKIIKARAGE
jgi:hypothetical protein